LLNEGYQHAATKVARRGVLVQAIQGNFHHWARYTQLHHVPERSHRRRVVTMLGSTLGNLDNEVSFFEQTLIGLATDDLLLLDVLVAKGDPQRREEVERNDLALQRGPSPLHAKWLTGPLRRYCEDLKSVELKHTLNVLTVVPGSYAINVAPRSKPATVSFVASHRCTATSDTTQRAWPRPCDTSAGSCY